LIRLVFAITLSGLLHIQALAPPAWTQVLPQQPGRVYAVGVAPLTANQAQSLNQAAQNARVEVVTQLRASVKSETSLSSYTSVQRQLGGATTANSQHQTSEASRITSQASDLPGLTVAETWLDITNHTVYALAYLDLQKAAMDLQARLDDIRKDNEGQVDQAVNTVDRARAIQRLKKGREELVRLEILMDPLVSAPTGSFLRSDIRTTLKEFERRVIDLRASLSLGLKGRGADLPEDLATVVQNAALKQGLGWSDGKGEFIIQVRLAGGAPTQAGQPWWRLTPSPVFTEARANLQVTIFDRLGHRYEAMPLEAYGVGTNDTTAGQGILQDCQKKFEALFDRWLNDLAL